MQARGAITSRRSGEVKANGRKADGATHAIGQRIVDGRLQPGELLPTEARLGRELGMSRPSLRESLRALAGKGLVESRTRRGTMVCPKTSWDILDADVLGWMAKAPPDHEYLMALLELRTIIEPAAARLAAQRASPRQILDIGRAYSAMAASLPDDVEACCRHDLELHEGIIAAAGNVFLSRFAAVIRTALLSSFRVSANAREIVRELALGTLGGCRRVTPPRAGRRRTRHASAAQGHGSRFGAGLHSYQAARAPW